jgi:hypothetical protein
MSSPTWENLFSIMWYCVYKPQTSTRFCERVMTWTSSTRLTMELVPDGDARAGRICCQSFVFLGPSSGSKFAMKETKLWHKVASKTESLVARKLAIRSN